MVGVTVLVVLVVGRWVELAWWLWSYPCCGGTYNTAVPVLTSWRCGRARAGGVRCWPLAVPALAELTWWLRPYPCCGGTCNPTVAVLTFWACPCWWYSLVADGGDRAGGAHMVAVFVPVLWWHTQDDRSRVGKLAGGRARLVVVHVVAFGGARVGGAHMVAVVIPVLR